MKNLHVAIKDKIATFQSRDGDIVCGNDDYQVVFTFDSEWDDYSAKTARFIWNSQYTDVVFTGTVVNVPVITNATLCAVGVYAGDIITTTPALIGCRKSITDGDPVHTDPAPDVYNQIIELLNSRIFTELVQTTGQNTDKAMSQKAVTDAIAGAGGKLYKHNFTIATAEEGTMFVSGVSTDPTPINIGAGEAPMSVTKTTRLHKLIESNAVLFDDYNMDEVHSTVIDGIYYEYNEDDDSWRFVVATAESSYQIDWGDSYGAYGGGEVSDRVVEI